MGNEEWGKCGVSIGQNPIQTDRQTDRQGVWCTNGSMFTQCQSTQDIVNSMQVGGHGEWGLGQMWCFNRAKPNTDRQTGRQTDRQTDRQTNRQTDKVYGAQIVTCFTGAEHTGHSQQHAGRRPAYIHTYKVHGAEMLACIHSVRAHRT